MGGKGGGGGPQGPDPYMVEMQQRQMELYNRQLQYQKDYMAFQVNQQNQRLQEAQAAKQKEADLLGEKQKMADEEMKKFYGPLSDASLSSSDTASLTRKSENTTTANGPLG